MVEQIRSSDYSTLCKRILVTIALAYRPFMLNELASAVDTLEDISNDLESLRVIIRLCGSLLTVREDTIYRMSCTSLRKIIYSHKRSMRSIPPDRKRSTTLSSRDRSRSCRRHYDGISISYGCQVTQSNKLASLTHIR